MSTPIVVLLIVTVLLPMGSAGENPVSDAVHTAEEKAAQARGEAQRTQEDAERTASDAQAQADEKVGDARATAARVQDKAKGLLYEAEMFAFLVFDAGCEVIRAVVAIGSGAADEVMSVLSPLTNALFTTHGQRQDAGFGSQSSEYAIARGGILAPLIWIAASAGGLLVAILVVRKLVGLGMIPLLSRIAHSDIYNNEARRTIHELVVGEAGMCLNDLVTRTGYSRNAVSYHLFVLEKEEEVVSVKDGKYRRYFNRNGKYVNGAKNVVAALRNETTLKLARAVVARPGSIQRDLCVELGSTPSATCWHAKRLLDLGVIRKERAANTVKYFPGEAVAKYDLSDLGLSAAVVPAPVQQA